MESPCACQIHCHRDCLNAYIKASNTFQCSICHKPFALSPQYEEFVQVRARWRPRSVELTEFHLRWLRLCMLTIVAYLFLLLAVPRFGQSVNQDEVVLFSVLCFLPSLVLVVWVLVRCAAQQFQRIVWEFYQRKYDALPI
jgi:uncharacterized membrane protein (DUF485 family)